MSFLKIPTRSEIAILLDIGSGSVSAAFVRFCKNEKPCILYAIRKEIPKEAERGSRRFLLAMTRVLDVALKDLLENGVRAVSSERGVRVSKVFCTLASPWFASKTKFIHISKPQDFTITSKLFSTLMADEERGFLEAVKEGTYLEDTKSSLEVVEHKMIGVRLNGYLTHAPKGKRVRDLDVAFYFSVASSEILEMIRDKVNETFHGKHVVFHTFPLASFSVSRTIFPEVENALILDVGGEVSDISLVKDGLLAETVTVPIGRNTFDRSATETLGTLPEVARSFARLYIAGKTEAVISLKLKKSFDLVGKEWSRLMASAVTEVSLRTFIPRMVWLTADSEYALFFKTLVEKGALLPTQSSVQQFHVTLLDPPALSPWYQTTEKKYDDEFIALESIFAHLIYL